MRRVLFLIGFLCLTTSTALAQDPVKVAPNNYKVLLENDQVRVLEFHSKAGEKIPMHSHRAYIAYSISGSGKTKFTSPDGKVTEREFQAGQATWNPAETHASESSGEVRALLIELKGVPSVKWYAYCDTTEKPPWTGPTRESIADAQRDADGHNEKNPKHHATVKETR